MKAALAFPILVAISLYEQPSLLTLLPRCVHFSSSFSGISFRSTFPLHPLFTLLTSVLFLLILSLLEAVCQVIVNAKARYGFGCIGNKVGQGRCGLFLNVQTLRQPNNGAPVYLAVYSGENP